MSHTPNQLDEDFPGMAERMHALKTSNNRFARLIEEYGALNREIHRVETRVEPTSEDVEEELKRRRVRRGKDRRRGVAAKPRAGRRAASARRDVGAPSSPAPGAHPRRRR